MVSDLEIKRLARQVAITRNHTTSLRRRLIASAGEIDVLRFKLERLVATGSALLASRDETNWAAFQLALAEGQALLRREEGG
jgi:hypothetical protein